MRSIAPRLFLAVLVLGLAMAAPAAAENSPACPLKVYARLPLFTLSSGLAAISVKLEDRDLYFLVDTGGFINTISQDVVEAMKLMPLPAPVKIYGIGHTMDSYVTPKSFSMGPISGDDLHFYVMPLVVRGIAGTLAPDTMRDFDVDFDFAEAKFGIFSSDHCPGKVVYWTKQEPIAAVTMNVDRNGHIRVAARLDGKDVTAVLDTGSDTSIIGMSAARQFLGIDDKTPGVVEKDVHINGAPHKTYRYSFQSLNIADLTIADPSVLILEDADMGQVGPDLMLGMNVLRQMHIYIAYHEGKIYLTPATAQ